jgi:di/tricarboxylate transporter
MRVGDELLVAGNEDRVQQLQELGLRVRHSSNPFLKARDVMLAEIIIPPRSSAEGKTLSDLGFRNQYGFTAVALWRGGRSYRTDVATFKLAPGDTLLLIGPQRKLAGLRNQQDFVVMEAVASGTGLDAPRVALTLAIALSALAAMFLGLPVELAMVAAAVLVLLSGLMTPEEAYAAIKWRAIFLIAGTISVSVAMVETGLARSVGDAVVAFVEPYGAMGLVAGAYVLSAALTQVMGGQISPLVVAPITISAAIQLGVNPQAIALVTGIAGSVSFITPLSHPVNILMIAPANYTFTDFVKSGWALTVLCFITLMIAVPLFWDL